MGKTFFLLLLLSGVCRAELHFEVVDGADTGIEKVLVAHKREANAAGQNTWLWGAAGWTDPSGSYLYFSFHRYGSGFLFKYNGDGTYTDISPTPPDNGTTRPSETRPIIMDVDNNGYLDILHTGDETPNGASLLNNGDGTWTFSRSHRITARIRVVDYNNDGYLDVQGRYGVHGKPGTGGIKTEINLAGKGFETRKELTTLPKNAPREVVKRVEAAHDRFHVTRIYDLDADTYIVTYGGAYGGEKFTFIVRNNKVVDIGLPQAGTAHPPVDLDGDGDLDVVIQHTESAGFYRQDDRGQFTRDESGAMPTINSALIEGAYEWDIWPIDLDEDGDNDLVLSSKRSGVGWILDNQNGVFRQVLRINHVDGEAMWPADVDGDGDTDVVVAGGGYAETDMRDSDQAALYINQLRKNEEFVFSEGAGSGLLWSFKQALKDGWTSIIALFSRELE